nr:SRPBCC family protein [uncultured Noviherbaspirillum sp.]
MEIQQSFTVPFPPALVWRCFQDIEGIVACLPGAALTAPPEQDQLKLSMTVKLGPIVAAFAGEGSMALDDSLMQGRLTGSGNDRKSGSRVKGEAAFSLHDASDAAPATRVDVKVDYSIAGSLAQFSRGGIVRELAERLTSAFSDNLRKKLEAENPQAAAASPAVPSSPAPNAPVEPASEAQTPIPQAASPTPATPAAPRAASAPLDLGGLFWPVLLRRIRRLFGLEKKA